MAWWVWTLIGLGALVVILFAYSYIRLKLVGNAKDSDSIIHVNDSNFKLHISKGIVIVDFWAEWCQPCKMMIPVLNQIAEEEQGTVKVCKLNVDKVKKTAAKFAVKSIPTLIIFKNGREMKRIVGVKPKNTVMKEVKALL
ncbi:MAG: thioredoxin [Bacteroidales bacterium]|nr:thioredoxin [Bacteroidales bacterium]